jgi:signal transduction histidine kinase
MSIDDNGVGFDPKTTKEGIGIQNMRQRVLLLKGKFTIVSIKKTNTFINISIPIRLKKEV